MSTENTAIADLRANANQYRQIISSLEITIEFHGKLIGTNIDLPGRHGPSAFEEGNKEKRQLLLDARRHLSDAQAVLELWEASNK